jgi:aldehyde dehydrogenase (NAD+)
MGIDKISFTGSTATGRKIQYAATKSNLKRVTLELGGKSPAIVFNDADLERSLFWCTFGVTANSGQVCVASSRLFVQAGIAEKFIEGLKERFKAIAAGLGADPLDKQTSYGPLVDHLQYERVSKYIQDAKQVTPPLVGGDEYAGDGYYVEPTIFFNPPNEAKIYREEIFGPVVCIKTFETEAEAVALANDTEYGLAGERPLTLSRRATLLIVPT